MVIVLIQWKIKPDSVEDFLRFWKEEAIVQDREGLVGEFLSEAHSTAEYSWINWQLTGCEQEYRSFVRRRGEARQRIMVESRRAVAGGFRIEQVESHVSSPRYFAPGVRFSRTRLSVRCRHERDFEFGAPQRVERF